MLFTAMPRLAGVLLIALATSLSSVPAVARAPEVTVERAELRSIRKEVRANGSVVALQAAALSPAVGGQVEQLHVDVGDVVAAGDALLELDPRVAAAELRAVQAQAKAAEIALEDARRRLREAQNLKASQGISESEIRSLEAEVAMDGEALSRLRAERDAAETRLERHSVKAPFPGVVSRRSTDLGEWVTPGNGIMDLVNTENLRLDFQVPQMHFAALSPTTPVTVVLDALPQKRLQARISAIVPVNDPQVRTFLVRTRLTEDTVHMTPGMAARAVFDIDTQRRSVVVPRDALLRHPDGRVTLWSVDEPSVDQSTVREHLVETGLSFDGLIEIRSGVEADTAVIVTGNESLREGQTVRIADNKGK